MYELWAKKRPVEGRGSPYEFITSFYRESQKYYITDQLDRSIYMECMVVKDNVCVFYREFDLPYTLKLRRNKNENNN